MQNIFNGKVQKNMETEDFLNSQDADAIRLRHCILYSARLATHIAIDKFIMAEVDMPDHKELLVSAC